ncbi:MAG: DUF1569 domain-containing protein [Burkholderiales bacterium]|nr:DUF1569 domain-containing protein [Burkholderiales bacterium]
MARRRRLLAAAALAPVALPLAGCSAAVVQRFPTLTEARRAVAGLTSGAARSTGAWNLPQVLQHLAQSVEYSIDGYPEMKSALFHYTLGVAAWSVFDARGAMNHALDQPIPGAPALEANQALEAGVVRLLAALNRFEAHTGALQPHFAYGALDKAAYTRAHLMHLANHWSLIDTPASPPGTKA